VEELEVDAELAQVQWQGDLSATVMRDFVRTVMWVRAGVGADDDGVGGRSSWLRFKISACLRKPLGSVPGDSLARLWGTPACATTIPHKLL
jgi:hypothetical protein